MNIEKQVQSLSISHKEPQVNILSKKEASDKLSLEVPFCQQVKLCIPK